MSTDPPGQLWFAQTDRITNDESASQKPRIDCYEPRDAPRSQRLTNRKTDDWNQRIIG
jgi:hypothetical protein